MAPLLLVGQRLADVVEEPHALGELDVGADLRRHHPGQPRDLFRVLEAVLTVRGAELHPADQLHQLGVQPLHADLEAGLLALLLQVLLHVPLDLLDDLLDPGRMDPAVRDQRLQRQARDLPAVGVVGRDDHRLGRVVDDQVHAGVLLEGADVSPLAPDDAALHVVARQVDDRDGGLDGVVRRQPLDGRGEDFLGLGVRRLARFLLESHGQKLRLATRLLLHAGEELALGLLGGEPRDRLELAPVLVERRGQAHLLLDALALAREEAPFLRLVVDDAPFDLVELPGQLLVFLADPLLDLLDLALPAAGLLLQLGPGLESQLPGFQLGGLAPGVGVALAFLEDSADALFRAADLAVGQ